MSEELSLERRLDFFQIDQETVATLRRIKPIIEA